jgi:hypothetical protein
MRNRIFLFKHFGPLYRYRVQQLTNPGQRYLDLVMRPVQRRMMYQPGTFVWIRVPSLPAHRNELHPFSISSSPVDRDLRVSVLQVGDFPRNPSTPQDRRAKWLGKTALPPSSGPIHRCPDPVQGGAPCRAGP